MQEAGIQEIVRNLMNIHLIGTRNRQKCVMFTSISWTRRVVIAIGIAMIGLGIAHTRYSLSESALSG